MLAGKAVLLWRFVQLKYIIFCAMQNALRLLNALVHHFHVESE